MKKIYLLAVVVLSAMFANAQMLTPTVIASTGGFSSNANGSLSYTVGEMTMVQTFSANGNILTQGFQQPNDNITGLIDMTKDEFGSFVVYPNPAVDDLTFGFQLPEASKVRVVLYNAVGQQVAEVYNGNYDTGKTVEQLNVTTYAAGVYVLSLTAVSDVDGKTHVISKKFQVIN
ncbi:MAG TPA: T9SS type A sorting domain-containing protein [Chitinophagales bacterium]|nr:T9SS type A sorting domain-containing protein [Chitinophagales bacterium]